ncbi:MULTISPECIES: Fic family protein [unclassified Streptomyces]|uniref:Fic family protein n=1 Tax=unclassified Streptomyces TaxID=2593676 RepID=UPI002DD9EDFE|nr:Fic family protein [Streptomyces sp. NBC_01750]WSB02084.1 Fic family protein [Streptomyces sp. NBC_01794]WSD33661.1 Fic family protein [Streptomyces sp. NBC_01750]
MLFQSPDLDAADLRTLDEIEAMRQELRHMLPSSRRWTKQLRRNLTARAIAGSNTIEGYAATVDDVEALMAGEEPLDTSDATRKELEGYQRAMTYIQALSDAGEEFRYDVGLINGLHCMIQEHHPLKRPGRLRKKSVYVSSPEDEMVPVYTAPDSDRVPALMEELAAWLNSGDLDVPVHVRASMAHLNLVKIHPWADGNGRMSRALSTLVFSREALVPPEFSSIEEWLGQGQNTYAYYAVLNETGGSEWSPGADTSAWVKFCLTGHHVQAQQAQRRIDLYSRGWIALVEAAAATGLDERVAAALLPAFTGGRVRRPVYQIDAELSVQQSTRDIRQMVRLGWLQQHGEARGRFYTAGPRTVAVRDVIRRSTEPFIYPYRR